EKKSGLKKSKRLKLKTGSFPFAKRSNSLQDNIIFGLPPCSAITPNEPVDYLSMGDEHLNTIPAMESNEFIKSCVENLVPNPSESEGENGCDVPACFTTFSNILFDAEYEFDSCDDQSLSDEDFPEEIFSNPLFEEEIIYTNYLGVVKLRLRLEYLRYELRLLYDNSSPRPLEEFVFENSDAEIESFSPSPIPNEDNDSHMEEIDLTFTLDDPIPPGIEEDDDDSERDVLIHEELLDNYSLSLPVPMPRLMITLASNQEKSPDLLSHRGLENFLSAKCPMMIHGKNIPILDVPLFHFYPLDQFKYGGNWVKLSDLKQTLRGRHPMPISSLSF
nr:hypothetical protein [Tanacetum cinerariifolium]